MQVVVEQRSAAKAFCQKLHVTLKHLRWHGNSELSAGANAKFEN